MARRKKIKNKLERDKMLFSSKKEKEKQKEILNVQKPTTNVEQETTQSQQQIIPLEIITYDLLVQLNNKIDALTEMLLKEIQK